MKLYTDDLVLRTVEDCDLNEVARMWNFEKGAISKRKARKAIHEMKNNHKKNKTGNLYHLCFAVFEKRRCKIIGWCGLDGKSTNKLHIFYLMDAAYRNKGYATQCAAKLLAYAFEEAEVPFVNGGCDKNNLASYSILQKIGMKQDGFDENGNPLFSIDRELYCQTKMHAQE